MLECFCLTVVQEGQTLQLREKVVWTPAGMTGEVIV
jgi:hypothetical protein